MCTDEFSGGRDPVKQNLLFQMKKQQSTEGKTGLRVDLLCTQARGAESGSGLSLVPCIVVL